MVMILIFILPTSNRLVVLVKLSSGKQAKQAMATMIACQYAVAPVILSIGVAGAVWVAYG
jgi:hypothetical protein